MKHPPGETLLFLDEIQNCPKAIQQLRYFYEEHPQLHVIAAGSLLEAVMASLHINGYRIYFQSPPPGARPHWYCVARDGFLDRVQCRRGVEGGVTQFYVSPLWRSLQDVYARRLHGQSRLSAGT